MRLPLRLPASALRLGSKRPGGLAVLPLLLPLLPIVEIPVAVSLRKELILR
jgi:hypothetical protein